MDTSNYTRYTRIALSVPYLKLMARLLWPERIIIARQIFVKQENLMVKK